MSSPEERVLTTPDLRLQYISKRPKKHPIHGIDAYYAIATVDKDMLMQKMNEEERRLLQVSIEEGIDPTVRMIRGSLRSTFAQAGGEGFDIHPDCTRILFRHDGTLEAHTHLYGMSDQSQEAVIPALQTAVSKKLFPAIARIGIFPASCLLKDEELEDALTSTLEITQAEILHKIAVTIPLSQPVFSFKPELYETKTLVTLLSEEGARERLSRLSMQEFDVPAGLHSREMRVGTLDVSSPHHHILLQPEMVDAEGVVIPDIQHGNSCLMDAGRTKVSYRDGVRHYEIYTTNEKSVNTDGLRVTAHIYKDRANAS